jgi:molybdate transport system substrate-binding protein
MKRFLTLCALMIATLTAPLRADPQPVTVFAAASLRGVLEEIAASYGAEVSLSYGGSGTMARQVAAGAPADVVALASVEWMDWLAEQGLPGPGQARTLAGNTLVVVGPRGAEPLAAAEEIAARLGGGGRLAMGQREAVPAGAYARQWLENAGLWDSLEPRLAETDNVRAALALVARGEAPLGVVYATDAGAEPGVAVLWQVPDDMHDPIRYPAAALTPAGADFLDYLGGPGAARVLAAAGFTPDGP